MLTLCMHLVWLHALSYAAGAQYLLRTSPGGDGVEPAGVWAGKLTITDQGKADDLYAHGFSSLDGVSSGGSGLGVKALSRDPVGRNMLLVTEDSTGKVSLSTGALCAHIKPSVLLHNVRMKDPDHPYMEDTECGYKCGWGPVAMYNGKVYFVLSAVLGKIYTQLKREIQIRVLDTVGCASTIAKLGLRDDDSLADFPVMDCSSLVATLLSEDYKKPSPRPTRWTTQHLAMGGHGGKLHFYVQLIDTSISGSPHISLVYAAEGDTGMKQLASSCLDDVYAGSVMVRGMGSVDYSQGVLCWTAGDALYCGTHVPGQASITPVTIIESGEVTEKGICTGDIPEPSLRRSVTGVAIAETRDHLAVYFGCYAELPGTGGLGLVTLHNHGLDKAVHSVTSAGKRVYGSHVIVLTALSSTCPYGTETPFTTRDPDMTLSATSSATSSPASGDITASCSCTTSVRDAQISAALSKHLPHYSVYIMATIATVYQIIGQQPLPLS